jgi:hypothetical protein
MLNIRRRTELAVRAGRRISVVSVALPAASTLLPGAVRNPTLADAFAAPLPAGASVDPQLWTEAIFRRPPPVVIWLLRLRNALVAPLGIERGDESAFATVAQTPHEVLLGTDASHLNFRASVLVQDLAAGPVVTVSTLAAAHSRMGRWYLSLVGLVHPWVVRAMMKNAIRRVFANNT